MSEKDFLTHNQQMKRLRDIKKISCSGSGDKEILCRLGYFNLINGYKNAFVAGKDAHGNHIYYRGTSIQELYALKQFDDELRSVLLKQLTRVEEEIRTVFAYKFDEVNDNGKITWYQIEAYDQRTGGAPVMAAISRAYRDVDNSSQEYVRYYLEHHKFIPTWIMVKVVSFSDFINLVNCSKKPVKQALFKMYGLFDNTGKEDFDLLIGSLHWIRIVRNSCAHNERIYTMCKPKSRIKTVYMDSLANSYSSGRDKRIMDLLVYMKYYSPHSEYVRFIGQVKDLLSDLKTKIRRAAFDNVRAELGIKDLAHLDKLCATQKSINYNKLSIL